MDTATPSFPFMKLPVDLRLMVYERIPREIKNINLRFDNGKLGLVLIRPYTYTAILATSKQVHAESVEIIRKTTTEFILAQPPRMAMRFGRGALISETASVIVAMITDYRESLKAAQSPPFPIPTEFTETSDSSELTYLFEDYFSKASEVLSWTKQAALCLRHQLKSVVVVAPFRWWKPTVEIALLEAQGWEQGHTRHTHKAYIYGLHPLFLPTEEDQAAAHILDLGRINDVRVDIVGLCKASKTLTFESPGRASIHPSILKYNRGHIRVLPEMAQSIWQKCWLES